MSIKTLKTLFPDDLVNGASDAHNIDLTTTSGRSQFFSMMWEDWKSNEIVLSDRDNTLYGSMYQVPRDRFSTFTTQQSKARRLASEYGLKEFWDFLIKDKYMRFRTQDDALYFRLVL